ncbi:MAG: hypothetical protein Q9191_008140, partial [Dirinaria sp. TL-2023a]
MSSTNEKIEKISVESMKITSNDQNYNPDLKNDVEQNELTAESSVETRVKLASLITSPSRAQQFLHVVISKRKRDDVTEEKMRDEHRSKIARAMLALLAQDSENEEKN